MECDAEQRTEICDLPVEIVDLIFDYLPVRSLKDASLVCRTWSKLTFSRQRMDRVQLKVDYSLMEPEDYLKLFSESKRQYRNVLLAYETEKILETYFTRLIDNFKTCVTSLKVRSSMFIGLWQLRDILRQVPNLKALTVNARMWKWPDEQSAHFQQFPVLQHLSDFVLEPDLALRLDEFDVRLIAPNLRSLDVDCDSERALEVYKHYSDRLHTVAVFFKTDNYFLRFCEINFPNLCKIDFYSDDDQFRDSDAVRAIGAFFARLKRLRHATLRCNITQPIVDTLTDNCRDLTHLHIKTEQLEKQSLIRLAQLTKLRVLILDGWIKSKIFENCKPLLSLQELHLRSVVINDDAMEFFEILSMITPKLRVLNATETDVDDNCLRFICSKFVTLEAMVLEFCPYLSVYGFECLDQLPNLFDLSIGYLDLPHDLFKMIPPNKISHFSLYRCDKLTDEDLLQIPNVFTMLSCLEIKSCHLITSAGVQRLRSLLPGCTVLEENVFD